MKLHVDILPAPQREFWDKYAADVPPHFVLYGGTAIALRYGHRQSLDFDFFTSRPCEEDAVRRALPALASSTLLMQEPDTLVVSLPVADGEVKLSFFGGIGFGRVGKPERPTARPAIASALDLLATKLKVIHQRIEPKDYLDIEVLLRSGLSLNEGIAAARALYGDAINPLNTAKAVAWFKDGGLERALPASTRKYLEQAATTLDPAVATRPLALTSSKLNG